MAPLEVIGAGLSHTCSSSFRDALNMLGYKTFHGMELLDRLDIDFSVFYDSYYFPEKQVDWDKIYDGYDAALDLPTAAFVGPLMKKYPNAKVLLVERDFESWYESAKTTIYWALCLTDPTSLGPHKLKLRAFYKSDLILEGMFKDQETFLDKEKMRAIYERHNTWIKENVPPEKLLIMNMEEGWDRMCKFLGKPIPDAPFPHTDTSKDFIATMRSRGLHDGPAPASASEKNEGGLVA